MPALLAAARIQHCQHNHHHDQTRPPATAFVEAHAIGCTVEFLRTFVCADHIPTAADTIDHNTRQGTALIDFTTRTLHGNLIEHYTATVTTHTEKHSGYRVAHCHLCPWHRHGPHHDAIDQYATWHAAHHADPTPPYTVTSQDLILCCLTAQQHERTCDYWYTVIHSTGTAHTAFTTAEELHEWLEPRGLTLTTDLPAERGTPAVIHILGTYHTTSHLDVNRFLAIEPIQMIPVMDNAEYTLGKITADPHGTRTIHHLNVNVRDGVYPWPRQQYEPGHRTILHAESKQHVLDYITAQHQHEPT